MAKPEVTLRRPADNVVAFVESGSVPTKLRETPDVTEAPHPLRWRRTVSTRADGTREKRLTIRLPESLAAKFARRCDDTGRSMSDAIAELIRLKLGDA